MRRPRDGQPGSGEAMIVNHLPALLARKGMSIRELGRQTGITYTTVWALVHGRRASVQLDVLDAVCVALQVQPGDIYGHVGAGAMAAGAPSPRPAPLGGDGSPATGRRPLDDDWRVWD
jgi:putative transcriptional regulator